MAFSSPTFLFLFLPLTLAAHAVVGPRRRNDILLAASMVFYVWGAGGAVLVLLLVAGTSYLAGLHVAARPGRRALAVPVALLLLPLLAFKYLPPVAELTRDLAAPALPVPQWTLPLGISFFTFHAISYVVDVSRGLVPAQRRPREHLLYLFLFPQQIAGPIVRYAELAGQLRARREVTLDDLGYGLTRFCWGLAKKAYVADSAGLVADAAFAAPTGGQGPDAATAWIGAIAYTVQIYCDFSGYCDMAIGLAAMFGFRFPENFASPYRSTGPADFWRRWHRTLSGWFRDYVYIPLGGNRHGRRREYTALLITFALTALWHGAAWTFLLWGAVHAIALLLERLRGGDRQAPTGAAAVARRAGMLLFLCLSWVPFRAETLHQALWFWQAMLTGWASGRGRPAPEVLLALTPWTLVALGLGALTALGPRDRTGFELVHGQRHRFNHPVAAVTGPAVLVVAVVAMMWLDFSPFLYFQF